MHYSEMEEGFWNASHGPLRPTQIRMGRDAFLEFHNIAIEVGGFPPIHRFNGANVVIDGALSPRTVIFEGGDPSPFQIEV